MQYVYSFRAYLSNDFAPCSDLQHDVNALRRTQNFRILGIHQVLVSLCRISSFPGESLFHHYFTTSVLRSVGHRG
jgi:hypothetical protein